MSDMDVNVDVEVSAGRMEEFLKDATVQMALALMKQQAYTDFLVAANNDERVMAQAKAKVLDTLEAALRSVVDAGERARIARERTERSPGTRPSTE